MKLSRIDHLVLTVQDIEATVAFYTEILGMVEEVFGERRIALKFGAQKINLHQRGSEFKPNAAAATPGSQDLCFVLDSTLDAVIGELRGRGVPIIEGPVGRTGALGPIRSIYIRDPDGNLIELSSYGDTEGEG